MNKKVFCFLLSIWMAFPVFADELESEPVFTSSDYRRIGTTIANQIIQSGILENVSEKKYSLRFGRIINESYYDFDTEDFVKNIRSALKSKMDIVKGNKKDLDFILAGKITERTATLANQKTRQEYYIELKLTDVQTGTELKTIKVPFVHKN